MEFPSLTNDRIEKLKISGFLIYLLGTIAFGIGLVVTIAKS